MPIQYTGRTPSERIRELLERIFADYNRVNIINNTRIVTEEDLSSYIQDADAFHILETAVLSGYENGTWNNIGGIMLHDEGYPLTEETRVINCTPSPLSGSIGLLDDNGRYIGQLSNNVLLLFSELDKMATTTFIKIFELFGMEMMSDEDYFIAQLKRMVVGNRELQTRELRGRMEEMSQRMNTLFQQFNQTQSEYYGAERTLVGAENHDEVMDERFRTQLERLFKSSFVDSVEFDGGKLKVITVPLEVGIWNIGQYSIEYTPDRMRPQICRVTPAVGDEYILTADGRNMVVRTNDHTHITHGGACAGNAGEMMEQFWKRDMLLGFNYAVQFVRSYHGGGGPHVRFGNWLMELGYINDAQILEEHGGVNRVDNGEIHVGSRRVSNDRLREWGCTGEMITDPEEYKRMIEESRVGDETRQRLGIEYIDWTGGEE